MIIRQRLKKKIQFGESKPQNRILNRPEQCLVLWLEMVILHKWHLPFSITCACLFLSNSGTGFLESRARNSGSAGSSSSATVWLMKCIKKSMAWIAVKKKKTHELLFGMEIRSEFRLEFLKNSTAVCWQLQIKLVTIWVMTV